MKNVQDFTDKPSEAGERDVTAKLWCTGCAAEHATGAFYLDRQGKPYGPCKEYRKAKRRERDQARTRELAQLRQTISTLVALATHQAEDPAGVITTSRVAARNPTHQEAERKACA